MKGSTAFVVHCPELSENQRIVVVGGCPELGGWELGDALSLTPAPCGRPWWVSSEVEVNLSECPLSVSEELEHRVETDGNVEAVRVSALKFRLVAIPNDGDIDQMPDLHNLVRLEPLKRGDFRVVRLVGAPPFPDYSSVGERGDNTIRVGVKGVGEQQTKEVVGISVEWGVPESVQLALLPRPSNSQTEHSQRESVNDCSVLSDHRSAAACPTSSEGGGQEESGRLNSMDGQGGKLGVSVCPSQTADAVRGSDTQRGGVEGENRVRESGTEETQVKKPIAHSDSSCRPADANTDSRSFPCHSRSPTFLLPPRDSSRPPRQGEEEAGRMRVAPLKRRLSESVLTQFENNDGKEMCAERMVAVGAGSGGKHRRLTVTLSPSEAALLSSDSLREREDPIVEGRVVVSGNECRGGEQGETVEGRAFVSTAAFALGARSAEGATFVSTVGVAIYVRSVGGRAFANTAGKETSARIVEGRASANTVASVVSARSVGGRVSVSTVAFVLDARTVGGRASVSTAGSVAIVGIVGGRASVSTVAFVVGAKIVEGRVSVSTVVFVVRAKNVEGRVSVNTVGSVVGAKSVEGRAFVSTASSVATVGIVGGEVSVSTVAFVLDARTVEGRASVSTAGSVTSARIVEGRASVSTAGTATIARTVAGRASVSMAESVAYVKTVEGRASAFTESSTNAARRASRPLLFLLDPFPCNSVFVEALS
uniref:CBM20 domain-containing protein n=1 Tax=Chromera velia CCMP2878 TaxID=1169474 RepID=A0A0G4IEV1_9ALVE|eukprot:Cvel_13829.t1-p1 / transcript=Cvel_13829.t1 / gene=Cvel_13829 / organism=Chromera_velia_CCMP2878 / gene_product=Zinc finger protein 283, putative / transcript_product=Zinc finger protein 283, putative / location=Cvel_scaffold960:25216-27403(-) / protein_length=708 / sequence_SO=supercontig / SO=protein_coding / is_pseudo=false